jgi:asparagine synthase (glutamine-hydrolysing)
MCGLAGFARATVSPQPLEGIDVLRNMTQTLVHRGPDGAGLKIFPRVALGHRRLAILDKAGGAQPMMHDELGLAVVFNGEIYNYLELNDQLRNLGFEPRTRSDTETLLLSYAAWGPECVQRFNGMFSFVLFDRPGQRLFAARDRMGKKPLYYYHDGPFLAFASEPKALLQHPRVRRCLDPDALVRYLMFEHVPAPYCIFKGMKKLRAGHRFLFHLRTGSLTAEPFWDHQLDQAIDAMSLAGQADEQYWVERIRRTLRSAVKRRLISDVPLGVFLSGGLDSSAITAAMCELCDPAAVQTFAIGFEEASFDESVHARRVAHHLGTCHHELRLSARDILTSLTSIVSILDEPFADASIFPCYHLARFARQHVTVALGGDGGDELFAGYSTFKALKWAQLYNRLIPSFLHKGVFQPLAHMLPVSHRDFSLDFKIKQFLRGVKTREEERLWRWLGAFVSDELHGLLSRDCLMELDLRGMYHSLTDWHARVRNHHPVVRDGYMYSRTYMADQILVKIDRASMACSLEARCPLLDPEMVALADTIPGTLKFRRGQLKYIFKKALNGVLPREILARPKKGFSMPVAAWLRGDLRSVLLDLLAPQRIRDAGIFCPQKVQTLVHEHLSGKKDNRKHLWTLLMFELWRDHWLSAALPTGDSIRPIVAVADETPPRLVA